MSSRDKADAIGDCMKHLDDQIEFHDTKMVEERAILTHLENAQHSFESMKTHWETQADREEAEESK